MNETIDTTTSRGKGDSSKTKQFYYTFWKEEDHVKLRTWWALLKNNPGWRAELRRAENPADVLLTQGFRQLCFDLAGWWTLEPRLLGLAAVAGILSHVETNDESCSFAARCALPGEKNRDKPVMSELRFSQLIKSRTLDELFIRMIRAIKLTGKKTNVVSVADTVFHWIKEMVDGESDNDPRKHIVVRLGLDYFQSPLFKTSNK